MSFRKEISQNVCFGEFLKTKKETKELKNRVKGLFGHNTNAEEHALIQADLAFHGPNTQGFLLLWFS